MLLIGNQLPFLQQLPQRPLLRKGASCCHCSLEKGGGFCFPFLLCFLPPLVSGALS